MKEELEKLKVIAEQQLDNLHQLESNPPMNAGVYQILKTIETMLADQPVWPVDGPSGLE